MEQDNEPLLNLHQILDDSAFLPQSQEPMITASFRIPRDLLKKTMTICANNNTDFSTFMRGVCLELAKDYGVLGQQ